MCVCERERGAPPQLVVYASREQPPLARHGSEALACSTFVSRSLSSHGDGWSDAAVVCGHAAAAAATNYRDGEQPPAAVPQGHAENGDGHEGRRESKDSWGKHERNPKPNHAQGQQHTHTHMYAEWRAKPLCILGGSGPSECGTRISGSSGPASNANPSSKASWALPSATPRTRSKDVAFTNHAQLASSTKDHPFRLAQICP